KCEVVARTGADVYVSRFEHLLRWLANTSKSQSEEATQGSQRKSHVVLLAPGNLKYPIRLGHRMVAGINPLRQEQSPGRPLLWLDRHGFVLRGRARQLITDTYRFQRGVGFLIDEEAAVITQLVRAPDE